MSDLDLQTSGEGAGVLTLRADANGAPVTVEVHGEGPPIVMIGAAVPREWAGPLTRDLRLDHAVVNFDYEPHDDWDGQVQHRTCVQMAADTLAVMDHIGLPRAHVVGLSRGAVCAYALGARHADRVLSVSLLVPVAPYPDLLLDPTPTNAAASAEPPEDPAELPRFFAGLAFSDATMAARGDELAAMLAGASGLSVQRLPRQEEEPIERDEVPQPLTLIALAADDRMVGRENAEALRATVPDATWVELPGEHGAVMEDPGSWADAIRTHVTSGG